MTDTVLIRYLDSSSLQELVATMYQAYLIASDAPRTSL